MPDATLTDEIDAGAVPASPNGQIPAQPGRTIAVKAQATSEYVAGTLRMVTIDYPRALPWAVDDLQNDFGLDIYSRMLLDAQISSVINVIKSSVLEDGVVLSPAVEDEGEDGYDQAKDLQERAEKMLDRVDIDTVLWDMTDAVAVCNKLAELVFDLDSLTGKREYALTTLSVKPAETYAFVVDSYLRVLGILARIPGQPFGVQQGQMMIDLTNAPNLLPRSKFAILAFRPKNADPRGTSILRPAFTPWNTKVQIAAEYIKYLSQFATPSIVAITAENALPYQVMAADGTPQFDINGQPVMRTPEQDAVTALESFKNGTAAAFPNGTVIQPIEMNGNGEAFQNAFDYCDRQITKAILNQTLATEEGLHQTRAASGTHKDILDTAIRQIKLTVERMIERDILRTWMTLNGEEALFDLMPKVTLGTVEEEDKSQLWTGAAQLRRAGYFAEDQMPEVDKMLGFTPRDPDAVESIPITEAIQIREDATGLPLPGGATAAAPQVAVSGQKPTGPVTT